MPDEISPSFEPATVHTTDEALASTTGVPTVRGVLADAVEDARPLVDPKFLLKPKFVLPFPTNVSSGTNLTDAFDGSPPGTQYFSMVIPQGGTNATVTIPIQGVEEAQWPARSYKEDKFVLISGSYAGFERVVLCAQEAGEATIKVVYEIQHQLALDAVCGINGGTMTLSMGPPPGSSGTNYLNLTATGGLKKAAMDNLVDSKHVMSTLALSMNAGWSLVSGSAHL